MAYIVGHASRYFQHDAGTQRSPDVIRRAFDDVRCFGPVLEPNPHSSSPPEAWEPLLRFARLASRPLEGFLRIQAASGILLFVAATAAMIWANSIWAASYEALWHTPIAIRIGNVEFERTLEWYVNDGLMVIFFFLVGLEIRREIHHGELSEWRRAALPVAAAAGGMLVPAGLYLLFARAPELRSGWGVPMATDIAFAVGILTLLGSRVPPALRVLLLALAVIDDLGAIIVIALFYSAGISLSGLAAAVMGLAVIFGMQRFGVRAKLAYVVPSLLAWAGIYAAGIHPTIAGVIVGFITPVRAWLGPKGFVRAARQELEQLAKVNTTALSSHELAGMLRQVSRVRREAMSPSESLIEMLHPWVAYGIMPVFALANAGVAISGEALDASSWTIVTGITVGLVIGKPLGVLMASWISLRMGVATLPVGVGFRQLTVLGVVAGVGFTMALFIGHLAFESAQFLTAAKLGVLVGSAIAAALCLGLGVTSLSTAPTPGAARSADEAESSTEV